MEPSQTFPEFKWNAAKREAALLLAQDELTDDEIGAKVGVTRRTLYNWRQHPEFAAKVKEHLDEFADSKRRYAIANRNRRLRNLDDRVARMMRVIEERAAAAEMQAAPGGSSGVLSHSVKSVGGGPASQIVDVYEFDAALMKELREHEKQAAMELGQWVEKQQVEGNVTLQLVEEIIDGNAGQEDHSTSPGTSGLPPQ